MPFNLNRRRSAPGNDSSGVEFTPLTAETPRESRQALDSSGEDETVRDAKPLRRSWLGLAFDGAITLLPLAFVGLLIAAASQDQKPQSATGNRIQQALILSPTIFPIVFAAICGKAMKSLALYRSQEGGASLRLLEQLAGAISLFSALERVVALHNFGAIGVATAVIWLLSPLGGQALSSRLLSQQNFYSDTVQETNYLDSAFLDFTWLASASGGASAKSDVMTMYLLPLSFPEDVLASPRDVWGNPKTAIPSEWAGEAGEGFKELPAQTNASSYRNLFGTPVKAFGDGTVSEFVVSSTNMEVKCSSLEKTGVKNFEQSCVDHALLRTLGDGGTYPNGTTVVEFQLGIGGGMSGAFIYVTSASWELFASDVTQPIEFFYGSRITLESVNTTSSNENLLGIPISLATCTMVPRRLETKLRCEGQTCRATAARKQTPVLGSDGVDALRRLLAYNLFAGTGASFHHVEKGQAERFLSTGSASDMGAKELWHLPVPVFEERFAQVFNTFWYAATATRAFATYAQSTGGENVSAAAVRTDLGPHYTCHWVWFGLGLAIVLLLEAISIANVLLRFRTRVPDVFGFVSSMTIGNKYCEDKGLVRSSALDGLERARALGHVRFSLADVKGAEEVGRIAFVPRLPAEDLTNGDQGKVGLSSVKRNRYYD